MTEFLRVGAISAETVEFSRVQRNDSPPGSNKFRMVYENAAGRISWRSNMLRLAYADSGSACKLAQDMVPTAHTQIDVRVQPLKNSAGRVPQAADCTCNKIS
jgi:hypothetical protein